MSVVATPVVGDPPDKPMLVDLYRALLQRVPGDGEVQAWGSVMSD